MELCHMTPQQKLSLQLSARITIFSVLASIYFQHPLFFIMSSSILYTSIKFWDTHHPTWRTLDISNVIFWTVISFFLSFQCSFQSIYLAIISLAILCFFAEIYSSQCGYNWVPFHVSLHILANIANFFLFAGIPSILHT